ncbi:hypothetical protein B0J12DRAFT_639370, partial [Macrophomina phaseolina]
MAFTWRRLLLLPSTVIALICTIPRPVSPSFNCWSAGRTALQMIKITTYSIPAILNQLSVNIVKSRGGSCFAKGGRKPVPMRRTD